MNEQDRIDKSYREREEGMNVTRMFIFIIIGFGLVAGILAISQPSAAQTTQRTLSLSGKCLVVPAMIFGVTVLGFMLRAIFGSFAERREHKQLVKERHVRENPPVAEKPQPKVLYAPSKNTKAERDRRAQEAIAKEREEYQRQKREEMRLRSEREKKARDKRRQEREDRERLAEIQKTSDEGKRSYFSGWKEG